MTRSPFLDRSWLAKYHGLSLDEAQMLAASERRPLRVLRPSDPVTADLNPQRLNLLLDDDGELAAIRAG